MKYFHNRPTIGIARIGIFLVGLLLAATSPANNFTTSVFQPYTWPPLTWNEAIWQPGPAVPTAGNSYEVLAGGLIRNPPAAGVQTFPGDSLTLDAGAGLRTKGLFGTTLNFPVVDENPGLVLRGGTVQAGDDRTFTIAGRVLVASDSFIDHCSAARSFIITAQIAGRGSLTLINGGDHQPLDIQSEHNPYNGDWLIVKGYLKGTGDGSLGAGGITVANGARLEVDYDIQSPGALALLGNDSVMILHQDCQFSSLTINDISLKPGRYSYPELIAQFPGNFADGGSGSITIVPAVSTSADLTSTDKALQMELALKGSGEVAGDAVDSAAASIGPGGSDTTLSLVLVADAIAPLLPDGVIVSADSTSQITIRWNASIDSGGSGIAGYNIYRNGALVATTTTTSYIDSGLSLGTQYCYTIVAFDGAGNNSAPSAQSCATTYTVDTVPPSIPNGVIVSANSATAVAVQWNASKDNGGTAVDGYRIYRNGILCDVTTMTSFPDHGLVPNTTYCYTVAAFDHAGNRSVVSAQACATTPPSPGAAPAPPSNLAATVVTTTSITLNWQDNSNNELGFQIERAPLIDGPWVAIGTVGANVTSYSDPGLTPATDYYYRVGAFN